MQEYTGNITSLENNEVFVFTSNDSGFHGGGSAGFASFGRAGNVWREENYDKKPNGFLGRWNVKGKAEGIQQGTDGRSYAIPSVTKPGARRSKTPEQITKGINTFYKYAVSHPNDKFYVAQSAKPGYNGYQPEEMATMWGHMPIPHNVYFLDEFAELIRNTTRYYAGIGSRSIDVDNYLLASKIAVELERQGWTLRSGNAQGSDQAFANEVKEKAQIWLPWASFEKEFQEERPKHTYLIINASDQDATDSVDKYHPCPDNFSGAVRKLMARNYRQVVGKNQLDSSFILCWTPNGETKGGTAQAIRIAKDKEIPVVNFGKPFIRDFLLKLFNFTE